MGDFVFLFFGRSAKDDVPFITDEDWVISEAMCAGDSASDASRANTLEVRDLSIFFDSADCAVVGSSSIWVIFDLL